jgi:hypothetical protein
MFKIIIVKENKTGQKLKEVNINETTKRLKETAKITTAKTLEFMGKSLLKLNKKLLEQIEEVQK